MVPAVRGVRGSRPVRASIFIKGMSWEALAIALDEMVTRKPKEISHALA